MNKKSFDQIINQVPVDYYDKGIKNNLLQRAWHTVKFNTFKAITSGQTFEDILDIGCASGTLTNRISSLYPDSKIIGVDIYSQAISYAQKKYNHIKFIKADAHKLPFKSNSFDLVFSYETIEHINNPDIMLKEIKRILKSTGISIITMDSGSLLFRIVWWFWEKTKGKVWQDAHLHPFHHSKLEEIVKKAGFKIKSKIFSHFGMEVTFILKK